MPLAPVKSNLRTMVSVIFGVFFLANVLLLVMAIWSTFDRGGKAGLLPEDLNAGVRILIFVVGVGISWFLGRWLFLQMVEGNMRIDESSNAAFVLVFYLMLLFLGFAFMSEWTWLWQAILLIVLILLTLFILRRILREVYAISIMAACFVIGAVVYVLFK